jgi:hypothetical protein
MTARELLNGLLDAGLSVSLQDGERIAVRPPERLTDDLRRAIRGSKPELLALLRTGRCLTDRLSAELALEVEEIERREFPGGFPPILARCVGHYLAGPCVPPREGIAAWWAGARRQVLRMIEAVKQDPARYAAWRPPEP